MYAAWLFFENRFKDIYFPDQSNWTSKITLTQSETGWDFDVVFPVRLLDENLYLRLSSAFSWEDGRTGSERRIPVEEHFKIISANGHPISIIIKNIERENLCFSKYLLQSNNLLIGRGEQADICVPDTVMSGIHGYLTVHGSTVEYTDQSTNGTYMNGRKLVGTTVRLQYGDVLTFPTGLKLIILGNWIALNRVQCVQHVRLQKCTPIKPVEREHGQTPSNSVYVQYHRSPRMLTKQEVTDIEIEPPIAKQTQTYQPLWQQIGPSFTMVVPMLMGTILGSRAGMASSGLIMVGTSSALAVMWGLVNRNYRSKQMRQIENQRISMYHQYIQEMEESLQEMNEREYQRLISSYPNVGQCAVFPSDNSRRLWNRMPTHSDFLHVRLGIGDVPFPSQIRTQKQKLSIIDDPLREEPERLAQAYSTISNAPVTIDLRREAVIGILGNAEAVLFAQGMLMQIAALHSYHDVRLCLLTSETTASQWSWVRWLPHVFANEDRELRMVASSPSAVHEIMSHLDDVLMIRKNNEESPDTGEEYELPLPHYVIFCTDFRLLEDEPAMRRLLTNRLGMTLVMLAPSLEMLPKECHLVLNVASDPGFLYTSEGDTRQVEFEYPSRTQLRSFAQEIAPLRIRDAAENAAIPTLVSFLDIYGVRRIEELDIWRMWSENHTCDGLKSIIGYSSGSRPFILDISDKQHGPHGLVAGTTGSGKSVMLQTYILSLSANYSPEEVQFILIDYKGGGMAKAFQDLPHVAGIIDNLQGERIISRALASLQGEIHRREALFKALNVADINEFSKQRQHDAELMKYVLPHLIIITDEFAELKSDQPEFMHELVSAARVGRSLGIHLILATQKPSSSVSDEIWANSRFHLCLRVQTRSDSMEMLKRPDAAYIKGSGRCFIQIGNDEMFEQVQTSYSGLDYNPNEPRAEEMPHLLNDIGQPLRVPKRSKVKGKESYNQMDAVLDRIDQVAKEHGMTQTKQMWLPEMPGQVAFGSMKMFLDGCMRDNTYPNFPEELSCILGMADDVAHQRYVPFVINITQMRNLMLVGLAGTGKTTAVQSMVYSLANRYDPAHLQMYILSLTSQTLGNLISFPHVGDIAFENDLVEIKRFINMIFEEEQRRSALFAKAATDSFIEYNRSQVMQGQPVVPAIVVFVDRFEQLKTMFANDDFYTNRIHALLREGSGRGIHFVVTALGKNEIPGKLHPFFSGISLQLRERADYSDVLGKRVPFEMPPLATFAGRGMGLWDSKPYEIQIGLAGQELGASALDHFVQLDDVLPYAVETRMQETEPLTDINRAKSIVAFAQKLSADWKGILPARIPRIPEKPDYEQFSAEPAFVEMLKSPYTLPVGYDVTKGILSSIDLEKNYAWMVSGPQKSGKSNFLKLIAKIFAARGADLLIIANPEWKAFATELGAKFASTPDEIAELSKWFVAEYPGKRRDLRNAALEKGKAEARKQALKFKPCAIIIDDAERLVKDFRSEQQQQNMLFLQNLYVQMASRAEFYNVSLFMGVGFTEKASMQSEPLRTLVAQGRCLMLGGKVSDCDMWGVGANLNIQLRGKALPAGSGYLACSGAVEQVIVPLAEQPEE